MQHYQVKISEYGQLCFRAPNEPEIVGFLWRINEWKGKSGTGYFGQVALFPSAMNPSMNTNIDYRVGGEIFTAAMPDLAADEYGEMPPSALEWQWIEADPGEYDETMWYELDKPDAPPQDWKAEMEYDMWLLDEPEPEAAPPSPDLEFAQWCRDTRQAIEHQFTYLTVANAANEMGLTAEFYNDVERGAVYAEDWHRENIERVLTGWLRAMPWP